MTLAPVGDVAEALLGYVETGTTFQSDKIMTVPARHYTDPERWAREVDVVFKRLPLMLALTIELPKPGDYKSMEAVGLPVLITRDKDGLARAFLNVCAHRGAPVAAAGCGNASRFACPYHGWAYSNDGRLIGVADRAKFGDIDVSARNLTALPCAERGGMIFVVLTPGAPINLDESFGPMLDAYDAKGLAHWHFLGSHEIHGANWKIAFDGYLEGYHFASLHPTTILPRTFSNVTHYEAHGPHLRIGFPQIDITKLRDRPRAEWDDAENVALDFVRILFPNVSVFLAPELAQIAQLFPGPTPDQNRTVLMYARPTPPKDEADAAATEQMVTFLRDVTYGEDYVMGAKIQKGLESGAHDSIILGKNERGNQFFHEYVDYYLRGDAAGPPPQL